MDLVPQSGGQAPDYQQFGLEIADILEQAHETARAHLLRAERSARDLLDRARAQAQDLEREAEERLASAHATAEQVLGQARRQAEQQAEDILRRAEEAAELLLRESQREARVIAEQQEAHRLEYERTIAGLEERHRTVAALLSRLGAALDGNPLPEGPRRARAELPSSDSRP